MAVKKIIAREFIMLMLLAVIIVLGWVGSLFYVQNLQSKIERIDAVIATKNDSLKAVIYHNRKALLEGLYSKYTDQILTTTRLNFINQKYGLNEDQLIKDFFNKYVPSPPLPPPPPKGSNKVITETFITDEDTYDIPINEICNFLAAMPKAELLLDSANFRQKIKVNEEISLLKREQAKYTAKFPESSFLLNFAVIASIIIFGVRYLYYAIRWSLKTLKE